jgi:arylsulfatase A-like enzyme
MAAGPDILWILSTQWRAQACGFAGDANASTPRLDRLAAEGIVFTEAVTPHPFGPFARAALLTGKPSPENGLGDYYDPLPEGARTVAHALGERGYATAFFGKWHLGRRDPAAPPVGEAHARIVVPPEARGGFRLWEGFESGFLLNDPWLHGSRLPRPVRFEGYQSDILCSRAAQWLATASRPWFCVVSTEAPHPPYDAPASGVPSGDPRAIRLAANVPLGGEIEARARRELSGYYAHIAATDRAIGSLVDSIDAGGSRPVVVFASVHGDMHGAHGLFRKGWPHEESIRVPLVLRIPGTGSARSASLVSLLDLPAWTLRWAEGPAQDPGAPSAGKEFQRISMPSVPPFPMQCDRRWSGVRTGKRKLVLGPGGRPWLHFDLENDPAETVNLAGDPSRAAEIRELRALASERPGAP